MEMSDEDKRRLRDIRDAWERKERRERREQLQTQQAEAKVKPQATKRSFAEDVSDFSSFRTMVAPALIRLLFWVGVVIFVIFGAMRLWSGEWMAGLGIVFFALIPWRVFCEMTIIFFRIHEDLVEIREELARGGDDGKVI
jgi:hypothetical protein